VLKIQKCPALREFCLEHKKKREKMAKSGPLEFIRQVRSEIKKITWPTRKETTVSTMAVFIMVFIVSIFLFLADQLIAWVIQLIIGLGL
jgi:preprotein translocase subunit SecE